MAETKRKAVINLLNEITRNERRWEQGEEDLIETTEWASRILALVEDGERIEGWAFQPPKEAWGPPGEWIVTPSNENAPSHAHRAVLTLEGEGSK